VSVDVAAYARRVREGPCFVCELVAGRLPHHIVHEDGHTIAFLNRYPTVVGYTLVAPRAHRIDVVRDFDEDDYVELQRIVRRVGLAICDAVEAERLYVASLGSNQGNAHVHWHLFPLPPEVPYEQQQLAALDWDDGSKVLDLTDEQQAALAARIRAAL
jgi:diadenosine tetraphosphate (Ap4A) HIT family hydrolase